MGTLLQNEKSIIEGARKRGGKRRFCVKLSLEHYRTERAKMQRVVRAGSRILRSSSIRSVAKGGFISSRGFASAPAAVVLDKQEVTIRVVDLLKSIPFVDPAKVSPTASFENDLQLDMLENVEVMMAVEEEFAVDIPDSEGNKFSTTAHLIDYITNHPHAK